MNTTQHARCPVLLHPACITNPDTVRAVQQATGRLVVINDGKPQLLKSEPRLFFTSGAEAFAPGEVAGRRFVIIDECDTGPFGGDAA